MRHAAAWPSPTVCGERTMEIAGRDRLIIAFIARYGMATSAVLHKVFFPGLTPKAVERVLTRLIRQGKVCSRPLFGKTAYYALTAASARDLGLNEARALRPMGTQALVQNYSILLFCTAADRRLRMTGAEFRARFPGLLPTDAERGQGKGQGLSTNRYYIDPGDIPALGGRPRLAIMVADFRSHPRRLVRKIRREFHKRECLKSFRQLFDDDQFLITLLTAFPEKAATLEAALARETFRTRVEVVPGFAELLITGGSR
jgi:hypothetical protein